MAENTIEQDIIVQSEDNTADRNIREGHNDDRVETATIVGDVEKNKIKDPEAQDIDFEKALIKEKPYSVYSNREKWAIVIISSVAGIFSPLTANIYFPAIPELSRLFGKSVELINLTVTMYMVLQGISPMFWGTLSDRLGRRPIFMACMVVLCGACIGLARVPTNAYWLLMVLRCLQAAGSASTVALGAGVIGDIATRAERGGFFGLYSIGPMIGPCIGPVIGGGLSDGLGWRSIFWFLCIGSALCFIVILCFLPETLRSLVGDGSIKPSPFYRPLIPIIGRKHAGVNDQETPPKKRFVNPLLMFFYPDVTLMLLFNATLYAVFYGVTASISTLFSDIYPFLNQTDIGLCFLGIGGGMAIGSVIGGKALDRDYERIKTKLEDEARNDPDSPYLPEDVAREENFPLEYARLRMMPLYYVIYVVTVIGYGWCLHQKVNIAGPLILQIIIGYNIIVLMNTVQTFLVDLVPNQSSSITACNNLARCSMGAGCVSVIDIIIRSVGVGWTYVILAALCIAVGPIMFIVLRMGPKWRAQRRAKQERAAAGY